MKIFIHVGFPKTGTTAIQYALKKFSKQLEKENIYYPLSDDDFKQRWLHQIVLKNNSCLPEDYISSFRNMVASYPSGSIILLSCEELTNKFMVDLDAKKFEKLRKAIDFPGVEINIISYIRRPDKYYLSLMQEKIKRYPGIENPCNFQARYVETLDFIRKSLSANLFVRDFDKKSLFNNDIIHDFFYTLGKYSLVSKYDIEAPITNESSSTEVMYLLNDLRLSKVCHPGQHQDINTYWKKIQKNAKNVNGLTKPVLKKEVEYLLLENHKTEIEAIRNTWGIDYSIENNGAGQSAYPSKDKIVGTEFICVVNKDKVSELIQTIVLS